jgi:hypothetical protein
MNTCPTHRHPEREFYGKVWYWQLNYQYNWQYVNVINLIARRQKNLNFNLLILSSVQMRAKINLRSFEIVRCVA